ncbi:MAG: FkbM family methyltransferase [Bacteroidales bacterium]
MGLLQKLLTSKPVERTKRKLAITTGIYMRIKKLGASASDDFRTVKILQTYGFDKVIDIGANTGQFAESLIDFGFRGEIISFEPTSVAYKMLEKRAGKYTNWNIAERCAIGNFNGNIDINVSHNSLFSSIKNITDEYASYNEGSKSKTIENVKIFTFDSLASTYIKKGEKVFLKIDTQGFEQEVLEGAQEALNSVNGVKIEIPLVPIYKEVKMGASDLLTYFEKRGFRCVSLQPVAVNNQTGVVHEIDGIFVKTGEV